MYLTIEKASTCAQVIFGSINAHFKQLKKCPNITTSGTYILYCGDRLQLGPIVIYLTFFECIHSKLGWHNLYQKINHLIYLIEIMWQQDDLDFATSFWRFHTRIPCSHDVDAINSRLINFNIIKMTFEFKLILFTKGISTNRIPCLCHQRFLFNSFYFWSSKFQLLM